MNNKIEIKIKQDIEEFNKPSKYSVAINCLHIGDDNDYSCFLLTVIKKLYPLDPKMAWKLFKTDSMLVDDFPFNSFCEFIEQCIKHDNEI